MTETLLTMTMYERAIDATVEQLRKSRGERLAAAGVGVTSSMNTATPAVIQQAVALVDALVVAGVIKDDE